MGDSLDAVVAELVSRSGATAARVVDARTGAVLASVGGVPGAGDEVATLVRMARDAAALAVACGGMEDLVLATRDAVHVLRSLTTTFVHVRMDPSRDPGSARRELASPALQRALAATLAPELPRQRTSTDGRDRPALAVLGSRGPATSAGALAVLALSSDGAVELPQRAPARPVPTAGVLHQNWARDLATLERLVAGLRRLN